MFSTKEYCEERKGGMRSKWYGGKNKGREEWKEEEREIREVEGLSQQCEGTVEQ